MQYCSTPEGASDRIEKLVALNIPHHPRSPVEPIELTRQKLGSDHYIVNFQDSDEADRAFAADPAHFFTMMMRRNEATRAEFEQLPPQMKVPSLLRKIAQKEAPGEALLSDSERDYYVAAFTNSGFTNPINWYRNWTTNWQALEGVDQVINIPTLFIGAVDDVFISPQHIEAMQPLVADLTIEMLEPCGHWSQQERPEDVNRLIIDWLAREDR